MPPEEFNRRACTLNTIDFNDGPIPVIEPPNKPVEVKIVWRNVIGLSILHLAALYGAYLSTGIKRESFFFFSLYNAFSGLSITAGAHRLWTHKSYKAKLPLRILLMIFNCACVENDIIEWARDHRMHHKYSETDADPHNSKRGFFFAHMGWLMVKKHPQIKAKGHTIDMSDLWRDPVLQFQHKYYLILCLIFTILIPTFVPILWGDSPYTSFFVGFALRYVIVLHSTWLVNSVAHMWGYRSYDKNIKPVETKIVSLFTFGEGYHNYHHTFPWDYKAAELPYTLNITTVFIDLMALIGLAYDLKSASSDLIQSRVKRTGDGSHKQWTHVPFGKENVT